MLTAGHSFADSLTNALGLEKTQQKLWKYEATEFQNKDEKILKSKKK